MSKRRRASSGASRGADGDDSDETEISSPGPPPTRKKKKLDPGEMCQQLYDAIRSHKKEDGTLLCDSFIRAPKRRQEPQYYEVVSQPIDLLRVQQKLKTDTYEDLDELSADIELLVNNAKAFYKPDTPEYKDAIELWTLYTKTKQALENGEEIKTHKVSRNGSTSRRSDNAEDLSETSTNNEEDNVFEELFSAVMTANADGRHMYGAFQFLPSKRRYPEYYDVIENPIDLKTIAQKIQSGEYTCLNDLEKDLLLMVRNACTFNEPGSQIYKDARALKKIIQIRKQDLEQQERGQRSKTSERIRSKRSSRVGPVPSSRTLAIIDPPDSDAEPDVKHSEESAAESDEDKADNDNPQWKLFEIVRNHLGPSGNRMSQPFWKLPSRKFYPDYYKEIKNPMSLNQIRGKVVHGNYGTLSELAGDMNIMFENAKQYNLPTSTLYKSAVKLQKLMQQKVQEMLELAQTSSSDDESLSSVKNQNSTPRPRGRPRINPLPVTASPPATPVQKTSPALKKKLHTVSRHLVELTCSDGRQPMLLFMEKPSKKLYPEYYNVIDRPIDMMTIESNIKHDRYISVDEIVSDFRLMFSNCRQFNEEGSMIYEDANLLERALNEKLREVTGSITYERKTPGKNLKTPSSKRQLSPHEQKLRTLYDAIRDYRDPKVNRQLALIFMKLPSKTEYPDYYELIKNPIDMERIAHKLKNGVYNSVNELASDFILMFDNACKYNEPDSQIYKDALTLQRVCLQTKQMLREEDDCVPDVSAGVQQLLLTLFSVVYNHQDEEGRCYSDSMAELPEHDEGTNGEKTRAISLDLIKRRLDKGLYKRLDHFQQDMFAVFERARRLSRTDSQIFEDSVELQSYYIDQRDKLCVNTLKSPALNFTKDMMVTSIELVKQCKLLQENPDDDESRSNADDSMPAGAAAFDQSQFMKGDFVYLLPDKGSKEQPIVQVEKVWTDNRNVPMITGNVYFRPHETYHVRTRKFLSQEVFKTDTRRTAPLDQVAGQCYVMNVKDYFKMRPEGYLDKDIYVCESRYSTKTRTFKKIKMWETSEREAKLVPRDVPLEPNRTVSVFRERVEKHKDELAELAELENVQEKERPDVVMYNPLGTDDENTYYEQYNTVCSGVIKTGDFVYVVTDGGKQMIAQVDTIWQTADNKCYFRGPFLIYPSEVTNVINKPFYKQEVLLTTMHDTSPLVGIVGKCAVLDYDEYLKCRPTEIPEADIFVCESQYDESSRICRRLKSGLRTFTHSKDVTVDEIYYFPRPLGPPALAGSHDNTPAFSKQHSNVDIDLKPQLTNLINTTIGNQDVDMLLENSMDESSMASPATPLSIGGNSNSYNPSLSSTQNQDRFQSTPHSSKKKKEQKQKIVTGYILYSSEVRKAIVANNPDCTFGEISRIVGNEWRSLPTATKQSWEERAAKCNEETAARVAEEMKELSQHAENDAKRQKISEVSDELSKDNFKIKDSGPEAISSSEDTSLCKSVLDNLIIKPNESQLLIKNVDVIPKHIAIDESAKAHSVSNNQTHSDENKPECASKSKTYNYSSALLNVNNEEAKAGSTITHKTHPSDTGNEIVDQNNSFTEKPIENASPILLSRLRRPITNIPSTARNDVNNSEIASRHTGDICSGYTPTMQTLLSNNCSNVFPSPYHSTSYNSEITDQIKNGPLQSTSKYELSPILPCLKTASIVKKDSPFDANSSIANNEKDSVIPAISTVLLATETNTKPDEIPTNSPLNDTDCTLPQTITENQTIVKEDKTSNSTQITSGQHNVSSEYDHNFKMSDAYTIYGDPTLEKHLLAEYVDGDTRITIMWCNPSEQSDHRELSEYGYMLDVTSIPNGRFSPYFNEIVTIYNNDVDFHDTESSTVQELMIYFSELNEKTFNTAFELLATVLPEFEPAEIKVTLIRKYVYDTIKRLYPEVAFTYCYVAVGNAIKQKAKSLNIKSSAHPNVGNVIKMCVGMALLPRDFVGRAWCAICTEAFPCLTYVSQLLDYMMEEWLYDEKFIDTWCGYTFLFPTVNCLKQWRAHHYSVLTMDYSFQMHLRSLMELDSYGKHLPAPRAMRIYHIRIEQDVYILYQGIISVRQYLLECL